MGNSIKRHIPNTITSLNLLSGCLSILLSFEGYILAAVYLIFFAAIFDFLDGMTARLLKVYSTLGKELDSLADVISFGAAPAFIVFQMMKTALYGTGQLPFYEYISAQEYLFLLIPFLIPVLSAVRLAKFNLDERQADSFIGLPTPANALFFVSLFIVTLTNSNAFVLNLFYNKYFLAILIVIFSLLLVAEFPMFSLKFKNLGLRDNKIRYLFIGLSVILLILLHSIAVPVIIILYLILSAINNWIFKLN
ncbi:MAG: CDP-diacylglycerol--serine O-phosphatidyltransferase [Bacteroidetes bacterium GWC2_33_15]|nr:MAG: CDP-diacylglycerol--serine O-phosphatidyltransferase [Bacteroidetes bacterium GWA2_33_15]OFX51340.1 MAG: CDP-diacylglycerol--serine O-phosphatidyltransferase [Bacteroidetes bacterium GWC2_33_15]OFX65119.1 MAG: CDP-diacylglycerol--serine O-phosphatidyltransferase [Bacteroidetes bacterium GWB2_32_14]OFX70716.1 MAG: CDP-diacylglycerol--serine O-phosphatidyltransferase [Bacteroidetes bacterium GWD2_33_33]